MAEQVSISAEALARDALTECEWRRHQMLILRQQLTDALAKIAELEAAAKPKAMNPKKAET